MDQLRFVESAYRLEHRHDDGNWVPMDEQPQHHGQAEHDPERRWSVGRIFRCTRCEESVTLAPSEGGSPERP